MPVDQESLKRVLMSIKGAARGFKKDQLAGRLKPDAPDVPADPLTMKPDDGSDPLADPMAIQAGDSTDPAADGDSPELAAAEAKLEAIRKLIGSV